MGCGLYTSFYNAARVCPGLLELGKEHILALQADGPLLNRAIRSLSKKYRPRLRPTIHGDAQNEPEDDEEDEDNLPLPEPVLLQVLGTIM